MPDRAAVITAFLDRAGWGTAARQPLAGDASNRRYERLTRAADGARAVLMDAPPDRGEDVRPFLSIARHLAGLGFSAPGILSASAEDGLLLLEDLGDDLVARVAGRDPARQEEIYAAAVDLLAELHRSPPPAGLGPYDAPTMARLACLPFEWYLPALGIHADAQAIEAFRAETETLLACHARPSVLVLRDFHAENLLWLPARQGPARVGLLDFQDALVGHPAYDLVSLLEDARRDVPGDLQDRMRARYVTASGADADAMDRACAVVGAQRNLRILGVFARLCVRDGKSGYLRLMPRVWGHLMRDLAHPDLARLRDRCLALVPPPEPDALERIAERCGRTR